MSRSRYRPRLSHSHVRRLERHERRVRVDAIAADYDARVAAMHGLEWWERQWEARMRGGYRKRDRRVVRAARAGVVLHNDVTAYLDRHSRAGYLVAMKCSCPACRGRWRWRTSGSTTT